jgi:hypothetical protein
MFAVDKCKAHTCAAPRGPSRELCTGIPR